MESTRSLFPGLLVFLALFLFSTPIQAQTQAYCSTQNTGNGDAAFWQWQSNGWCKDHCNSQGTFAFAVVKFTDCWCSNYIPSDQDNLSNCQVNCPGFPSEKCGSNDDNLYLYLALGAKPSGTAGGDSAPSSTDVSSAPASSSKNAPSSSNVVTPPPAPPSQRPSSAAQPDPITVTQTIIGQVPVITSTLSGRRTSSTPVPKPSSKRPSSTPDNVVTSPLPTSATALQTSVQVITESGAVVTRTVIWQPTSDSSQTQVSSSSGSNNTAAIVGGVVGGVAGILIIVGAILFCLWRRRKQQRSEEDGPTSITRNTSTMSKAGLISGRGDKDAHYPPTISTTQGAAASRYDNESISPVSGSHRRLSQPMMIDSRLNPDAVLMFHPTLANTSRESLTSIDDSRDYGRQLNVRNPDPS